MTSCRRFAVVSMLLWLIGYGATSSNAADRATDADPKCPPVGTDKPCSSNAICHYKFTVIEDHGSSMKVELPESVFSVTCDKEKGNSKETAYKNGRKGKPFDIAVNAHATAEAKKTYAFERCAVSPDTSYVMGKKLKDDKDQTLEDGGQTSEKCD